jgi:hypothetical protein
MATNTQAVPKAPKAPKEKPAAVDQIIGQMKRSTLQGKLSVEELDKVAQLANALKLFVAA